MLGVLVCLAFSSSALADWNNPSTEYRDRIKTAQTIQPLGETPFGESVDLYKGGLTFKQTDISYPGIGPTITLSRSYSIGGATAHGYGYDELADWALSIPRIETILPGSGPTLGRWLTPSLSDQRCTSFGKVSSEPYEVSMQTHWWNGYKLRTPDGGVQTLLGRDAAHNALAPSDGKTYNIVTAANWMVRCTDIENPGANGITGQGFVALAPDGTTYTFNHMVYGPALPEVQDESQTPMQHLPRKMGYLYVTEIRDRFGNTIVYHYDSAGRVDSIVGSDGRQVGFVYGAGLVTITLQPGSAAAQSWKYQFTGATLSSVELPDHSKWLLSMNDTDRLDMMSDPQGCGGNAQVPTGNPLPITITHPSGLIGVFNVDYVELGRSKVPNACNPGTQTTPPYDNIPPYYYAVSLKSKSISGPGVTTQTWTYTYGFNPSTDPNCAITGCWASSWVDVGAPDGSTIRYTHSAEWGPLEGKLLSITAGITTAQPAGLRTETHEYASSTQGPYPSHVGNDFGIDGTVNDGPVEYLSPENKVTTSLQSVNFVRSIAAFDAYQQPLSITRSSTGNAGGNTPKTDTLTYANNTSAWVLSQPATTTVAGTLVSETLYDTSSALPTTQKSFGLVQRTMAYNADGTLASVTDLGSHTTTLTQWYRGIPRLVNFPTGFHISAEVDDAGKIASTSDEYDYKTSYGYDPAGRLNAITYPTGDPVAWNGLAGSFTQVLVAEHGIPEKHWKQIVTTGTGQTTTFYDARWLPVLTLTEDTAIGAASQSYVVQRYDGLGRPTFKSYPVANANVDDTLKGVTTIYDPLGRPIQAKQDSELGVLVTSTDYLSGFRTQVTNPRGKATITSYQVFDAPSTDAPVLIQAPQGQTTTITRDIFGAPLTITRSGPGN